MKTTRLTTTLFGSLAVALLLAAFVIVRLAIAQTPAHVMENLGAAKWGPAPPMLPPGAQIAVLAGDPTKPVPYTVRLKFPANYDIPAHSHPTDENVAVVSGELFMGMGTKLDKKAGAGPRRGRLRPDARERQSLRLHEGRNHDRCSTARDRSSSST